MMNLERGGEFSFFNIQGIAKKLKDIPWQLNEAGFSIIYVCGFVCVDACVFA